MDDAGARIYGHGVYVGNKPCPRLGGRPNPCIELDDGKGIVWGCECWWGPVDQVAAKIGTLLVTVVPLPVP